MPELKPYDKVALKWTFIIGPAILVVFILFL